MGQSITKDFFNTCRGHELYDIGDKLPVNSDSKSLDTFMVELTCGGLPFPQTPSTADEFAKSIERRFIHGQLVALRRSDGEYYLGRIESNEYARPVGQWDVVDVRQWLDD